jgi:hypothetical protein
MSKTIILGAGKTQRIDGADHLDRFTFEGIQITHDLNLIPWPIKDSTYMHASAIHVVEHLHSLINFMNEAHRILQVGGDLYIETPEAGADSDLTHADPTHIRCYRKYTFINYFTPRGIENFGYTDKAWCMHKTDAVNGVLHIHCSPIK